MLTASLHSSNRLVRKSVLRMFPASFAVSLTGSIGIMMDTLLAGSMISQSAIAAVAIGLPAIGIFQALTQTITSGAIIKMSIYSGRGDRDGVNRAFSMGILATVLTGLFFLAVCLRLAEPIAMVFGGSAAPAVAAQAALYIRGASVCVLMGSVNIFLSKTLTLYGLQGASFIAALIAVLGNVFFSILYIHLFPAELAIAALGVGTWCGGSLAVLLSILTIRVKKLPLHLSLKHLRLAELPSIIKLGLPTSGNNLADGVVAAVINNIIVRAFGGDTTALSTYTAVKGVVQFALTPILGTTVASAPLFGILYGARDRSAILRTLRESFKVGFCVSTAWSCVLIALLPFLGRFYGMQGDPTFRSGVIFCLLFMPLHLITRLFVQIYESTEKVATGLLFSIIPDSVIYPILLTLLIPSLGYWGIWISYIANTLPFMVILYLSRSVKYRSFHTNFDRLLCLDESVRDNVPMLDISIPAGNTDVTGISAQVHAFLSAEGASARTAYITALCLEEMAADFVTHIEQQDLRDANRTVMDLKLFSGDDSFRIIMRNAAKPYNPLDFRYDDATFAKIGVKMVQKFAKHIDYNYVYKLNIVTIDVAK